MLFSAALVRPTKSLPYSPFFCHVPPRLVSSYIFISPLSLLRFADISLLFPVMLCSEDGQ